MNLGIQNGCEGAIIIHCDNQVAIAFTKDPKYYSITKYMDTKYNYARDIIAKWEVVVQYISMHSMVVDPLTKPILRYVFLAHINSLGLCERPFSYLWLLVSRQLYRMGHPFRL